MKDSTIAQVEDAGSFKSYTTPRKLATHGPPLHFEQKFTADYGSRIQLDQVTRSLP